MSKMDDYEKRVDKMSKKQKEDKSAVHFLLGIVMIAVGCFVVARNTSVTAGWYSWSVGGLSLPTGVVAIPLLVGIGWLFFDSKSKIAKIILILGGAFILVTIILSVHIHFRTTDLYTYILIFGCIFGGIGLLLKSLVKRKDD